MIFMNLSPMLSKTRPKVRTRPKTAGARHTVSLESLTAPLSTSPISRLHAPLDNFLPLERAERVARGSKGKKSSRLVLSSRNVGAGKVKHCVRCGSANVVLKVRMLLQFPAIERLPFPSTNFLTHTPLSLSPPLLSPFAVARVPLLWARCIINYTESFDFRKGARQGPKGISSTRKGAGGARLFAEAGSQKGQRARTPIRITQSRIREKVCKPRGSSQRREGAIQVGKVQRKGDACRRNGQIDEQG